MINGMDREYVDVCMNYIKEWIVEYEAQNLGITVEEVEYIVEKGGAGIREVEQCFKKIVETAKEYKVDKIDKNFIDTVIS